MSHVLLAPDKFKGSLPAAGVAAHLAAGLRQAAPGVRTAELPVADGGDGTVDAAVAAGYRRLQTAVRGPTGAPVVGSFAVRDRTAVVEIAEACGLRRLPAKVPSPGRRASRESAPSYGVPAPLASSSFGAGQLISAAVRAGCRRIVLGLGGSACTDGGAGLVQALRVRLLDADGAELPSGGAALSRLHRLGLTGFREDLEGVEVVVASDVDNPLLGPSGAAAVYGPQKGATVRDVAELEIGLARWAEVVERELGVSYSNTPGAGAAGGIGFAALAFLSASLRPGIELLLDLLGFADAIRGATLVITGEGSLDAQTLHGKAPAGVAAAARQAGVPVVAVCGRSELDGAALRAAGIAAAYPLTGLEPDLEKCVADAGPLLERLAARVAADWLSGERRAG